MSDLHDAIMSLDPPESASDFGDRLDERLAAAYRRGFRAARLAAAELVSAQPAIKPGYVLVPVEPTPEMLAACVRCWTARDLYVEMIAAAPKEPT